MASLKTLIFLSRKGKTEAEGFIFPARTLTLVSTPGYYYRDGYLFMNIVSKLQKKPSIDDIANALAGIPPNLHFLYNFQTKLDISLFIKNRIKQNKRDMERDERLRFVKKHHLPLECFWSPFRISVFFKLREKKSDLGKFDNDSSEVY